jgi:predicted nucleotide-binding protein
MRGQCKEKVCALYKQEIEIPSDYNGVIWIEYDSNSNWQLELAREIKASGIEVDLNKMI